MDKLNKGEITEIEYYNLYKSWLKQYVNHNGFYEKHLFLTNKYFKHKMK